MSPSGFHPVEKTATADRCRLVLEKSGQRYVFDYEPGGEAEVLRDVLERVNDPDSGLEWFDAAMLCHQLGHGMAAVLSRMKKAG